MLSICCFYDQQKLALRTLILSLRLSTNYQRSSDYIFTRCRGTSSRCALPPTSCSRYGFFTDKSGQIC
nr:MAG TPA: hypothetical protein [Caudoviricetes sp.]DAT54476.1 MAG TPA: hypothetical protein [Caudoviricetes sp.]